MVSVPVTIRGMPAEGRHYTKKATIPINKLGITVADIALAPTLEERLRNVKRLVLDQLPRDRPIYNLGYESYTLDEEGDWAIMEETMGIHPDSGRGEVYLDQETVNPSYSLQAAHRRGAVQASQEERRRDRRRLVSRLALLAPAVHRCARSEEARSARRHCASFV